MKSKKFVSLLLAACLSIGAMSVNVWAENGNEQKEETPAPVVQELEGEKPEETKPEETKPEETKPDETKPDETKPADPPVAATYGTDVVASERKLETLVTYHIQMVNKDGKPITNTTFEVRRPMGRDLMGWAGENATSSDENGWLDLTVVDPFMAGSFIGNAANDFYLKAPDGTWYWANLGPKGGVYVLYVYIGSKSKPWLDYDGKDENNNYKNFTRVTLKPEKPEPEPKPEPTPAESTITVEKRVEGKDLTKEELKDLVVELKRTLEINVKGIDDPFRPAQLLDENETETNNGVTWKWEPQSFDGTVTEGDVTETGEKVDDYTCNTDIKVEPTKQSQLSKLDPINPNNEKTFQVSGDFFFAAALTNAGGNQSGTVVITRKPLDKALRDKFEADYIKGEWKEPVSYYSVDGDTVPITLTVGDAKLTYDPDKDTITFEDPSNWKKVLMGTVETVISTTVTVTNTYTKKEVTPEGGTFTITKVDAADTTKKLAGATFTLTAVVEDGQPANEPAYEKTTDANGEAKFENVPLGKYILKETVAPENYVKPSEYYTVEVKADGTISVRKFTAPSGDGFIVDIPNIPSNPNPGEVVDAANNNFVVKNTQQDVPNPNPNPNPNPDPRPDPKPDDRPTYRYDDDDDYVLPTVTRKDNKKPANKPERAPRVEEVIPSKRNPETGSSSSMPIAMAAAAVSLTGLVVLCKKKDK